MKLTKRSSFNKKLALFGVMLILTLGSATPGYGVNYHFEEDFSDSLLTGWKFIQYDFTNPQWDATVNHTFVLENEKLVSTGSFDKHKENIAFVLDKTAFGGWSFDLFIPSNLTQTHEIHLEMFKDEPGETIWPTFALNVERDSLKLLATDGTSEVYSNRVIYEERMTILEMEYDKYQHYDLIRTADQFYVFIDKMIVGNWNFSVNLDSINYFAVGATQGSNVTYDNIQITTDVTGLLNELLGQTSPDTSSTNETLFLVIGTGSIALTGGASSWRRLQKKRIARLVKISSNGAFPKISNTISHIFNNKKPLYFLLLGHKTQDTKLVDNKLEASLKSEMFQYRHFLHPFRLSIMQLLYSSSKITSIEIKDRLELSWSDYYSALRQLENLSLVDVFDGFDENGTTRQFVIMKESGAREYDEFIRLIEKFVGVAKQNMRNYDENDLYPR